MTNGRRPACPTPRPQPASCSAPTFANSGLAFRWRGCKAQRWRDILPPDHDNVPLDITDSTSFPPQKRKRGRPMACRSPDKQTSLWDKSLFPSFLHTFASGSWATITRSRAQSSSRRFFSNKHWRVARKQTLIQVSKAPCEVRQMPAPRGASDDLNLRMQRAASSNGCRLLGRGLRESRESPALTLPVRGAPNKVFFFNTEAVGPRLRSLHILISQCFHAPTIRRHTSWAPRAIRGCSHVTRQNSPRDPSSCSAI